MTCATGREGSSPSLCTLAQKSVDRSKEKQSLLRDITLDQSRTRENKESSSHGHLYPISLTDRACGYGPQDVGSIPTLGAMVLAKATNKKMCGWLTLQLMTDKA